MAAPHQAQDTAALRRASPSERARHQRKCAPARRPPRTGRWYLAARSAPDVAVRLHAGELGSRRSFQLPCPQRPGQPPETRPTNPTAAGARGVKARDLESLVLGMRMLRSSGTSDHIGAGEPVEVYGAGSSGAPDCCCERVGLCPGRGARTRSPGARRPGTPVLQEETPELPRAEPSRSRSARFARTGASVSCVGSCRLSGVVTGTSLLQVPACIAVRRTDRGRIDGRTTRPWGPTPCAATAVRLDREWSELDRDWINHRVEHRHGQSQPVTGIVRGPRASSL